MASALSQVRLIGGRVLIVAGLLLFAMWVKYIAGIQAVPDLLDVAPLLVAIAVVALGVWLAPFRGWTGQVVSSLAVSWKRDLALSLAVAVIVVAILGPGVYYLGIDTPLVWSLEALQAPGAAGAMAIYRGLGRWSLHLAVGCGFVILVAMWTGGVFVLLSAVRVMRGRRVVQRV
jgi:hypothetical protein